MKNKKGIEFLGGHVVNLIISVIIIILLVFLGLKIYGLFVNEGSDLEQANTQLLKIKEVSDGTFDKKKLGTIEAFFTPANGWFIRSFSEASASNLQDLPRACIGQVGCLCICQSFNCEGTISCIGTDYDLKFRGIKYTYKSGGVDFQKEEVTEIEYTEDIVEFMRLGNSIYQIQTSVNEGGVLLTPLFK